MKKLLALALLAACHDTKVVVPSTPTPPGQMTVTGTATLEVSPDCADLTMTLSADNLTPGPATAQVQREEEALVAALQKLGVEGADLKLSYQTLQPVYDDHWIKIRTYRAQITVTATTHDFTKIASLMEAGANAGATSLSSAFRRSDLAELKKKVRAMALTAAKDKATQTADTLGIKLGPIVSVAENAGGKMWSNEYFPNAMASQASPATLGGAMEPLTLDVTIGYELTREI
jgi:uncharacterized protein YggE